MKPVTWSSAALLGLTLSVALAGPAVAETPPPRAPEPSAAPAKSAAETEAAQRVIAASTLAERIDAQRRLVEEERRFLDARTAELNASVAVADARIVELRARADARRAVLSRVLQQAYRESRSSVLQVFLETGSIFDAIRHADQLSAIGGQQQTLIAEIDRLESDERRERDAMVRERADLLTVAESLRAKDSTLARLAARSNELLAAAASGKASTAEMDVIRQLADDAARAGEQTDDLIAQIASRAGVTLLVPAKWVWPVLGTLTQEFGPTALALEPARVYRGIAYPHFHDGLDIGAPLGTPVLAVSRGRVAFVGHLADGAMVVLVAHDGGFVSGYGHLDDASIAPPVRVGDVVEAGQRLGAIGITGLTTGPHVHFTLRLGTTIVDPRAVLPAR